MVSVVHYEQAKYKTSVSVPYTVKQKSTIRVAIIFARSYAKKQTGPLGYNRVKASLLEHQIFYRVEATGPQE